VVHKDATEAAVTAIVATLRATPAVVALVNGVYNNVPQGTSYPYVEVRSATGVRKDMFSRPGQETLVDVKALTQTFGDQEGVRIRSQVLQALDLQQPIVAEHVILGMGFETLDNLQEMIAGKLTRHHIATFRVWTEQSST